MKLNNKGFAISTVMYIILIMAVILITLTLSILSSRKLILDKLRNESSNNIYNVFDISYREALEILKSEAVVYATENSIEKDSVKISDLNSSIDKEILDAYKLSEKYLTMDYNDSLYDVYLGKSLIVTENNQSVENLIDIVNYKIEGNSVQQTYSGKNLFDISKVISNSYVVNNGNGTLSVTPTSTSSGVGAKSPRTLKDYAPSLEVGKTYILSAKTTGENKYIYLGTSEFIWYFGKTRTITQEDLDSNVSWYATGTDTTFTAVISEIQIEQGSTATSYEPYVGGVASPNPEYPQEIKSVGELVTDSSDPNYGKYKIPVTVSGKNLIANEFYSGNTTLQGITYEAGNGSLIMSGTSIEDHIYDLIKSGLSLKSGTYTLSWNGEINTTEDFRFYVRDVDSETTLAHMWTYQSSATFTLSQDYDNVRLYLVVEGGAEISAEFSPMLEEGTEATEYEPYVEPVTTNIYLDEPLRKIGDYTDYIDFETGKVFRNVGKALLGDFNWVFIDGSDLNKQFWANEPLENYNPSTAYYTDIGIYSDTFIVNTANSTPQGNNYLCTTINYPKLRVKADEIETPEEFKSTFANSEVYYRFATSIEEPIQLPKLNSNMGTQYISIDTSTQPSNIELTAIQKIRQL